MQVELGFLSDDAATGVEDGDWSFEWNCEKAVARGEYIKICWIDPML